MLNSLRHGFLINKTRQKRLPYRPIVEIKLDAVHRVFSMEHAIGAQ